MRRLAARPGVAHAGWPAGSQPAVTPPATAAGALPLPVAAFRLTAPWGSRPPLSDPPLAPRLPCAPRCDSGLTLATVRDRLVEAGAASVTSCVLLDKKARRKVDFVPDYIGLDCPNQWVAGERAGT